MDLGSTPTTSFSDSNCADQETHDDSLTESELKQLARYLDVPLDQLKAKKLDPAQVRQSLATMKKDKNDVHMGYVFGSAPIGLVSGIGVAFATGSGLTGLALNGAIIFGSICYGSLKKGKKFHAAKDTACTYVRNAQPQIPKFIK